MAGATFSSGSSKGLDQEIVYTYNETVPFKCFTPEAHEITHYLNSQYTSNLAPWISEGITRLIEYKLLTQTLCPPGYVYTDVYKTENDIRTKVIGFKFTGINSSDPLSYDLEYYSEGKQCRKGIFMEFNKLLDDKGYSIIKPFYIEINTMGSFSDNDYARALWKAAGERSSVKTFLEHNECDL